jgi:hypothetical protein
LCVKAITFKYFKAVLNLTEQKYHYKRDAMSTLCQTGVFRMVIN